MKQNFVNMAVSIAKFGGFFVGRYESSLVKKYTRQLAGNVSMNTGSDSEKNWYELYKRQDNFDSEQNIANSVKSQMIWASQYEAIMSWMNKDNTIDVTLENAKNGVTRNTTRITGNTIASDGETKINDKLKNIYDLNNYIV